MARTPGVFDSTRAEERAERDPLDPLGRRQSIGGVRTEADLGEERRDAEAQARIAQDLLEERHSRFQTDERDLTKQLGHVSIPPSNSYIGYKHLHDSGLSDMRFSTFDYPLFDGVIADTYGKDAFDNPNNDDAEKYNPLKRNIAIVRSYIYATYFPKQAQQDDPKAYFDNQEKYAQILPQIAQTLGRALWVSRIPLIGKFIARAWYKLDVDKAMTPDAGAVAIYEHLLRMQDRASIFNPASWFSKKPGHDWGLTPMEDSIFSPEHMWVNDLDLSPWQPGAARTKANDLLTSAFHIDRIANNLRHPEQLPQPTLDRAIQHARDILDKFRIVGGNSPQNASLALNEADETAQARELWNLAIIYQDYAASIAKTNPELLKSPVFDETRKALRKLSYLIKQQAVEDLQNENNPAAAETVVTLLGNALPEWRVPPGTDFQTLASQLEAGLEEAARIKGQPPRAHSLSAGDVAHLKSMNQAFAAAPNAQAFAKEQAELDRMRIDQAKKLGADLQATTTDARISQVNRPAAVDLALHANERTQAPAQPDGPDHLLGPTRQ